MQIVEVVEVEPGNLAEAVSQRAGDQTDPGRRSDKRERGQLKTDRARCGTLAQHDVELEVLHRWVQDFFDLLGQAMDLVDEQHIALAELGQNGREVAGAFKRWPRGRVDRRLHLAGHDVGERGLAEPGRAGEHQVVGSLAAVTGSAQDDL